MPIDSSQRHRPETPCPICGGHDKLPRGDGNRCFGFRSEDGKWAHCTRDEFRGALTAHPQSQTYAHVLEGECKCGQTHGAARNAEGRRRNPPAHRSPSSSSPRSERPAKRQPSRIVKTYDYTDAAGKLLFQCVRLDPKDFRQRQPDPDRPGQWLWTLKGLEPVLYRLPELLSAPAGRPVYILEGEAGITISGEKHHLKAGEMIRIQADAPHALEALTRLKVMSFKVKPGD